MKILKNVAPDQLVNLVPRGYRDRLPKSAPETTYVVLLFKTGLNDVNLSGSVRRGLRKVASCVGQVPLVVGSVFTVEAIDVLNKEGVEIVSLGGFGWTDQDYQQIRRPGR